MDCLSIFYLLAIQKFIKLINIAVTCLLIQLGYEKSAIFKRAKSALYGRVCFSLLNTACVYF